jgi:exonuclease III
MSILKQSRKPSLHNIASDWPIVNERYSIWVDKNRNCIDDDPSEHSFIDHLLVSQGLKARVVTSRPYHNYTEYCGTLNSDHWPVYVVFNMA